MHRFKRPTHFQISVASRMQQGGERETMTTEIFPLYSRLDPEITARLRARALAAKATTAQSALEYILFAIFGATILIAAIALIVTNSASFRRVPNLVSEGIRADRVNIL